VWIDGELREKAGDNTVIIDGEKWANFGGRWSPIGRSLAGTGPMIMPDIQPYTSMIDGSTITSRSHHREHLRAHGCIEVGNERLPPPKREFTAAQGLREELIARIKG
jgi:hypothetical protein